MTAYQYRQPTQEEYDEYDYGDNDSPQSYGGYGKSQQYGYDYDNRGLSEHTGHARQEEGDDSVSTPRIPIIQRVESGKENDDGLLSPRRFTEQVGAFEQMCAAGAGWGSALMAAVQGHKMTEEQAAICLQSHWRRHEAMVQVTARDMAARHIQDQLREQIYLREGASPQDGMHGSFDHGEVGSVYEHDAATVINAAWRGHLSRSYVNGMRAKKAKTTSSVKRTFSFSSKKKRDKPAHQPPATPVAPAAEEDPFANMHANNAAQSGKKASLGSRVRRSLSFDRKSSSTSSSSVQSTSATKRTFVVERGPNGLGLELDATNTVVTVKPGGRAERQGLLALGDTILSIDGKSCAGVLMQDVMVPGRSVYVMEVSRPERAAYAPPPKAGIVRRSLSFDTKKGGGVKRSFSFERKR